MRATSLAITLRLLAHPELGARGISDAEREELAEAATELERLAAVGQGLAKALMGVMEYGAVANGDGYEALKQWIGIDGGTNELRNQ